MNHEEVSDKEAIKIVNEKSFKIAKKIALLCLEETDHYNDHVAFALIGAAISIALSSLIDMCVKDKAYSTKLETLDCIFRMARNNLENLEEKREQTKNGTDH